MGTESASEGILERLAAFLRAERRGWLQRWRSLGDGYDKGGAVAVQRVIDELKRLRGE